VAAQDGFAEQDFPLLNRDQITQLGMAHGEGKRPASSYTLVEGKKPADAFRVGIFGGSFVNGKEAGPGQDFPSQLQRFFAADEYQSVRVLNFGVGAFGVQQSYLLWQYLSGDFELDYTIYSLYGFHRNRDNSFIMLNTIFAPVHARYVLDGESIRLVRVNGADRREAAHGYFRLIPRWNYLRFDAKTPPQIRALLPSGRELPSNPFYYRRNKEQEVIELYGRVFADMAVRSKRFLVLLNDQTSEDLVGPVLNVRAFNSVRTSTEAFTWDRNGLYRAPRNHPSALGYYVLAKETHAILAGRKEVHLPDVEILGAIESEKVSEMKMGLSDYDDVYLSFDGMPAAVFVKSSANRTAETYSFDSNQTDSILDVSGPRSPLFIALKGKIPGEDLRLRFSVSGSPIEVVLGRISFVGGRYVGVLIPSWTTTRGEGWRLKARPEASAISVDVVSEQEVTGMRLEVGGRTLLRGVLRPRRDSRVHRISWRSAEADFIATRGHPEQNAGVIAASGGGDYCITTKRNGSPEEHWCTRRWQLESTPVKVNPAGIPPISD
jgi:hypothetical protein